MVYQTAPFSVSLKDLKTQISRSGLRPFFDAEYLQNG